MEKPISISININVNNKEKLKHILKISLFAAVGTAALFGALGIKLFYNSNFPIYLLMFVPVFVSAFCVSATVRAASKRNVIAALCGIPIGIFVAVYQIYDTFKRASDNVDVLLRVWVITAVCCVSASIISMIISLAIGRRAVKN